MCQQIVLNYVWNINILLMTHTFVTYLHIWIHAMLTSIHRPLTTGSKTVAPKGHTVWRLHCMCVCVRVCVNVIWINTRYICCFLNQKDMYCYWSCVIIVLFWLSFENCRISLSMPTGLPHLSVCVCLSLMTESLFICMCIYLY